MTWEEAMLCPVCLEHDGYWGDAPYTAEVNCPRCGTFKITGTAIPAFMSEVDVSNDNGQPRLGPKGSRKRANASAWVRENGPTSLNSNDAARLCAIPTPTVSERAEKLLRALRSASEFVGEEINVNNPDWLARSWSLNREEINGIANYLEGKGLVSIGHKTIGPTGYIPLSVSPRGWEYLESTERNKNASAEAGQTLADILAGGESSTVEFKSTLRTDLLRGKKDAAIEFEVCKTIAALLNTNGGTLLIGVNDDGKALGLEADGFKNEDKALLHLMNLVKGRIGAEFSGLLDPRFEIVDGIRVIVVRCSPSNSPVFLTDGKNELFFVRSGPSSVKLSPSETHRYIKQRFN